MRGIGNRAMMHAALKRIGVPPGECAGGALQGAEFRKSWMIPRSGEGADCEDADVPRPSGWENVMKILKSLWRTGCGS